MAPENSKPVINHKPLVFDSVSEIDLRNDPEESAIRWPNVKLVRHKILLNLIFYFID